MIGIGVGIDYALFIVTRYREALQRTSSPEAAVLEAMTTSGRAVVFAGFTVMISVLGMLLMGLHFLHGLAVGTSLAVVIAVLAAITLAARAARLRRLHPSTGSRSAAASSAPARAMWHRWARVVQRRPAIDRVRRFRRPVRRDRCRRSRCGSASADASNDPSGEHDPQGLRPHRPRLRPRRERADPRRGRHHHARLGRRSVRSSLDALRATPGRRRRSATRCRTRPAPRRSPRSSRPRDRRTRRRSSSSTTCATTSCRGATRGHRARRCTSAARPRAAIDFADVIGQRLPLFIGAVLALSFLLLLLVFRSVLVPLKAVIMNLLSIGAAYGVIVAVFQWGWGGSSSA